MVGRLLWRGMLVGLVAGLLCFAFLKVAGEPSVDRAIAFETRMEEAKAELAAQEAKAKGLPAPVVTDDEMFSRATQAGIGLFTGVTLYNTAFGGLFALVFALAYGRMGGASPRTTAALLAGMGFCAIYLVPNLKYPANPPSIGHADTIGLRTGLYFSMIALSLIAMVAASKLRLLVLRRLGAWDAALLAIGFYLVAVSIAAALLPAIDEVPAQFPADVLWRFRVVAMGAQSIMWASIGLGFGVAASRALGYATREPARRSALAG